MKIPEKAVVLAAGYGARMIPLSLTTPKPMMPLWGKPVIAHVFEALKRWGVRQVVVNLHHQPGSIIEYARQAKTEGLMVNFSFEPEILGTGGVLRKATWFLDESPFWMINADIAFDLDPHPILDAFSSRRFIAALWLNDRAGPRTVEMTKGKITNFQSKHPGAKDTYTFCGLQLLTPEILRYVPEQGYSTIIQAYNRCMAKGHKIAGVCPSHAFWADIGTPESYLAAHGSVFECFTEKQPGSRLFDTSQNIRIEKLRKKGIGISGFVSIGSGVSVANKASISNSVIWNDVTIADGVVVKNAIIADNARVRGNVPRVAMRLSQACPKSDTVLDIALKKLKWDPASTTFVQFEPRGSAREFVRLENEAERVIMMRYSLEREENALYTRHARFLKNAGWPVPEIILDMPEMQFAIIEDMGDYSLLHMVESASLSRVPGVYQRILKSVAELHRRTGKKARKAQLPLAPPFTDGLYLWEREFFARHFLEGRLNLPEKQIECILGELSGIASTLLREQPVLIHRDLQSSNILLVNRQPFFIDFQGMRFGPAAYDLASLLCDPYVELPVMMQKRLLASYNEKVAVKERISDNIFQAAAIERLAQALGAYARLSANPETAWYEKYILPGLRMMLIALRQNDQCPNLQNAMRAALEP